MKRRLRRLVCWARREHVDGEALFRARGVLVRVMSCRRCGRVTEAASYRGAYPLARR